MVESVATAFGSALTGFPRRVFHAVHGERLVADVKELSGLPDDLTQWFASKADADAARTQADAEVVSHHDTHQRRAEMMGGGVVRQSVQAQDAADRSKEGS